MNTNIIINKNKDIKCEIKDNYPVDEKSNIPFEQMDFSSDTKMPPPIKNSGLYGGKSVCKPWIPKPLIPTGTNYMKQLANANPPPPPGAIKQYVELNRLGNNFSPSPGVKWYADTNKVNCGPFNIKGL